MKHPSHFKTGRRATISVVVFVSVAMLLVFSTSASRRNGRSDGKRTAASLRASTGPHIYLDESRELPVAYVGDMSARESLTVGEASPLSMTSGDFDGDGVDDLLVGYGTSQGGIIAFHRGNLDAFAPQSKESFDAIGRGDFPSPFLKEARVFSIPVSPDFIATGYFRTSEYKSLVVAARGGNALYVFAGDGRGNFTNPQTVNLPGGVTALAAGQLGNTQPYTNLIVGVSGDASALMIFKGAEGGPHSLACYPLQAAASNIEFGDFGDGHDAAFLSGGKISILRSSSMQVETVSLPVSVSALALGSFVSDRNPGLQIALLGSDGNIHIAVRNGFDPRPYSLEEMKIIRTANRSGKPNPLAPVKSVPANGWQIAETIAAGAVFAGKQPVFFRTRVSDNAVDDLMVLNSAIGKLVVISHPDLPQGATSIIPAQISVRPYSGAAVAALSTRINVDGRPGIVLLESGQAAPSVLMPLPDPTFFPNRFDDIAPRGTGVTCLNTGGVDASNDCTLREAIIKANATAGTDTIMLQAGTYTLTRARNAGDHSTSLQGTLEVQDSVNITGAGQNSTIIQAGTNAGNTGTPNGVDMVIAFNEDIDSFTNATVSVSNLTIQNGFNRGNTAGVQDGDGGGFEYDTGINGTANLTMTNVTVAHNGLNDGRGGGGALFNTKNGSGMATFTNCIIQNNNAHRNPADGVMDPNGAGDGGGLAMLFPVTATMNTTQVLNNTATQVQGTGLGQGGGIWKTGGGNLNLPLTIHGGAISGNQSSGDGGGILATSALSIDQGTVINGNTAGASGGGIWVNSGNAGESATLTKVTITGNSASGFGGGIFIGAAGKPATISFSRFAGNSSAVASGANLANQAAVPGSAVTATNNWWGTNAASTTISPSTSHCAAGAQQVCFDPFIVLTNTASPAKIRINQSTTLTGDMSNDNHGNAVGLLNLDRIIGLPITFDTPVLGTIPQAQPETLNANAQATATFNAGGTGGRGSAHATVDQAVVSANSNLIASATEASTTVTITTVGVHNFAAGETVVISGVGVGGYNGTFTILSTPTTTTFTYADTAGLGASSGGTANVGIIILQPPSITKSFSPTTIKVNGTSTITFSITNPNVVTINASFTDDLTSGGTVSGLVVASTPSVVNGCGGSVTANAGANSISFLNAALPVSASPCTITVNVTGTSDGIKPNSVTIDSTDAGNGNTATASPSLTVINPPTINKVFGASTIPLNGTTSLTFTITNPNSNAASVLNGISFTETLPNAAPGTLVVATPNGLTNTCSTTPTATAGSGTVSLTGASLAAGASCTIAVNVKGTVAGLAPNSVTVSDTVAGTGNTSSTSLTVVAPPTINKAFNPTSIPLNTDSTLTFTIANPNTTAAGNLTGVAFSDTLPLSGGPGSATLVVSSTPSVSNTCGGTATATAGTGVISLSGASVAHNASCTLSVNVTGTVAGDGNNTTGAITSTEGGTGATSNTATLKVVAPPTISKAFGASTIPLNGTTTVTFTITNPAANSVAETGIAFSDTLTNGLQVASTPGVTNSCGGTVTAAANSTSISLTGGSVATPGSTCTIVVNVTGTQAGVVTNTTGTVSSTNGGTGATSNTATLTVVAPATVTKTFAPTKIPLNGTTLLTINITNPNSTVSLTGLSFTDSLAAGLVVASTPNLSNTCGGTATATAGSSTVSLSGGTVASSASCAVSVNVQGTTAGDKLNSVTVSSTEGGTSTAATATVTVVAPPTISKAFNPSGSIPLNGISTLTFTISNPNNPATPANGDLTGVAFSDTLPSTTGTLGVAPTPNVSNTCGGTVTATAGTGVISLSGGTLAHNTSCTLSVDVKGTAAGDAANTTGAITSTEGGTGTTSNTATVKVVAPPFIQKSFAACTVPPTGMVSWWPGDGNANDIQDSNNGALQGGATFATGEVGQAFSFSSDGDEVLVTHSANQNTGAEITVDAWIKPTTFNTANASIINKRTNANAEGYTLELPDHTNGLNFEITTSGGVFTANAANVLTANVWQHVAGTYDGTKVRVFVNGLEVGSSAANGTINAVTADLVIGKNIFTGASFPGLIDEVELFNRALAQPEIASIFNAGSNGKCKTTPSIPVNGTTSLTFTIMNPAANTTAENGIAFSDTLTNGLQVASTPGVSNTCNGTVTATANTTAISLSGGSITTPGTTCTISVNVTGTQSGQVSNTTGAVSSTNGGTGNTATANLTVASPPTIAKSFNPTSIALNASSTLTFTINNPNTNVTLTGIGFTDTLPAGLVVASPPNLTGVCGGTVTNGSNGTLAANDTSIKLAGGTLAGSGQCTIKVGVKGTTAGVKLNTTGAIGSTEGGTGTTSNTASITVVAPPTISKAFNPSVSIPLNGVATLTFTINNPNTTAAGDLTGVAFSDTLPSATGTLVVAPTPNVSTTCGGGVGIVTATSGSGVISVSGGSVTHNSSCTVSVDVKGTAAGDAANTTGAISSTEGGTGTTSNTATLKVVAPPSIAKVFNPRTIALNATASLTFTITNPAANTVSENGVAFSDTLPTGLTIADSSSTQCGGTLTTTAATRVISLSGGTINTNSNCQFSVTVTGAAGGQYTNVTGNVTSTNGGTGNTASANLTVGCPASFTVNDAGDTSDASAGDGTCADANGKCTLRAAIEEANALTGCSGTIDINFSIAGTITLNSGELSISHNVNINGPGANLLTISGNNASRVFNVQSGKTVNISSLTVANGKATGGNNGGGVLNNGTLTLTNTTVSGNNAAPLVGNGGGIYNTGTLTLASSIVSGNTAPMGGGGIYGGTITLTNSTVSGNNGAAGNGGGIANPATLTLRNSTISGNFLNSGVGGSGGGIYNSGGTVVGTNSSFTGNSAPSGPGGGIYNISTLTLTNSTVSGNSTGGSGGGIVSFGGPMILTNVTITNNRSDSDNSGGEQGGGISHGSSTAMLRNTIVAGNFRGTGTTRDDVSGAVDATSSFNLIGDGSNMTGITNGSSGNQVGTSGSPINAMLGALANNGGATQTHLLLPGSPAINAGTDVTTLNGAINNSVMTVTVTDGTSIPDGVGFAIQVDSEQMIVTGKSGNTLTVTRGANSTTATAHNNGAGVNSAFDQRGTGFPRKVGSSVDIGAVEVNYAISATAGTPQSAMINTAFATQLQATVTESGNPVSGIPVTFTPPASGASGTFPGNVTTANAATNASGVATAPTFTANGTAGPYNVVASIGAGLPTANFALTNTKGNQTITFGALANKTFGDADFNVSATASSGLPVSLAASGNCTVTSPSPGTVHLTGAGSCTITASQAGDSNYKAAANVQQSFMIAKAATTTGVTSSVNPSNAGQSVTFTATVTPAPNTTTPMGTVQFKDNGANLGTPQTLNAGGVATFTTSSLSAGTHTITAEYSGDTNFNGSTGTLSGGQVVKAQVSLSINDVSLPEGNSGTTNFNFTVTLLAASNLTVTVDFATANGTATAGSDYVANSGTLIFNPGDLTKTITVLVNGNTLNEPDKTFFVNLTNPVNATISKAQGKGTILNDDAPTIQFNMANYVVNESSPRVDLTVVRTGDTSGEASVNFATIDDAGLQPCNVKNGIASQRCDYELTIGTLTWAAGDSSPKTFSVPIIDDSYAEGNETFRVALSNPTGATLGTPATAMVTIIDNDTVDGPNPIDTTDFFIRQHYLDFLGREPEPAGLQGWRDILNGCGTTVSPPCDRIEVSSDFFRSAEFQGRGYFIYRFYSSIGVIPTYELFMPDYARVSGFLSDQQLEANKVAFINDFMARPAFQSMYGSLTDPTAYVNALLQTVGLPNHPTRQTWINGLTNGTLTRAQVLRGLVESAEMYQKYYNEAFVIMEYFGYLRRTADSSYLQWIQIMNQTGGDYRIMVNGFINSAEYRQRFGP